jgi:hypothetical protein
MTPVDRVVFLPHNDHRITAVTVIVDCACGHCSEADTEELAIEEWEQHVENEAHTGGHGTERPPTQRPT